MQQTCEKDDSSNVWCDTQRADAVLQDVVGWPDHDFDRCLVRALKRNSSATYLLAGLALIKRDVHAVLVHPAAIPKCLSTLGLFNCPECRVWAVHGY